MVSISVLSAQCLSFNKKLIITTCSINRSRSVRQSYIFVVGRSCQIHYLLELKMRRKQLSESPRQAIHLRLVGRARACWLHSHKSSRYVGTRNVVCGTWIDNFKFPVRRGYTSPERFIRRWDHDPQIIGTMTRYVAGLISRGLLIKLTRHMN